MVQSQDQPQEVKPSKDINLVLGYGRVSEAHEDKKGFPKIWLIVGGFAFLGLLVSAVIIGWLKAAPPASVSGGTASPTAKPQATPTLVSPDDPTFWLEYRDQKNSFSLKYPREATIQKRPDNPFPVAVAIKHDDAVVEITPGSERPGWLLTVSVTQVNDKPLPLREWAPQNGLSLPTTVTETNLAGQTAIFWRSPIFPESYYLVSRPEGITFIKIVIQSQLVDKHQVTVNKILATLNFSNKSNDPDLGLKWTRKQFGSAWDIEYPDSWSADETFVNEGRLTLRGSVGGRAYQVEFSYPNLSGGNYPTVPSSLAEWVGAEAANLSAPEREALVSQAVKVAGTDGWVVLNYRQTDRLYLWQRGNKNPSLVVLSQTEGEFNSDQMARLLDRFTTGTR